MNAFQDESRQRMDVLLESIYQLRQFDGAPAEFWNMLLEGGATITGAGFGALMTPGPDGGNWRLMAVWPAQAQAQLRASGMSGRIQHIADACLLQGCAWEPGDVSGNTLAPNAVVGVRLKLPESDRSGVAVFGLNDDTRMDGDEALLRMGLIADVPLAYQSTREARQARMDVVHFTEALDLLVLVNEEHRFMAAAMTICNEVASRYSCERVSIGWRKGPYVRVKAISHSENFEKKMVAVQALETAMEEAVDQDEEIVLPPPADTHTVARAHEQYAASQGGGHLMSLPLRLEGAPVAVITCERSAEAFSDSEQRGLRLLCDLGARRLGDLHHHDRWIGARFADWLRSKLARFFGVEHTLAKAIGVLVFLLFAFVLFGRLPYRVEAPFVVRTDDLAYLPAPFEGYIEEVHVEIGDLVVPRAPLLALDTSELLLEESTVLANHNRYTREAEKARAEAALADMRIAEALAAQASAELDLVRYHLDHALVTAPFKGIVVEGDFKELLGAPVRKGDVLFKVARIEQLFVELEVDERDIHEVAADGTGEISFISRPHLTFPITVERIDPVAVTREEGNVFLLRGRIEGSSADWWRPGMSGIAKVDVGNRNVLWIITHRTVEFLRMWLWW